MMSSMEGNSHWPRLLARWRSLFLWCSISDLCLSATYSVTAATAKTQLQRNASGATAGVSAPPPNPSPGPDLLGEAGARLRGGVRRAGLRLHGDQLHLVALATHAVGRAAGQPVDVVEDGGGGQEVLRSAA